MCRPATSPPTPHAASCSPACENGGTCIAVNECSCTSDWSGAGCTEPVCDPPCVNGGLCIDLGIFGHKCACFCNWIGPDCSTREMPHTTHAVELSLVACLPIFVVHGLLPLVTVIGSLGDMAICSNMVTAVPIRKECFGPAVMHVAPYSSSS